MSGKNEFLKKRDERDRRFFNAGMMMGCQMVHDYVQMALRDTDVMGKDVFGRKRIEKVFAKCMEYDGYYDLCFTSHVEADKRQEEMDLVLKEIWGKDLCPFAERYPYTKYYGYNKPLKEWVE